MMTARMAWAGLMDTTANKGADTMNEKTTVENMTTGHGHSKAANQFVITTGRGKTFQSYKTAIAFRPADGSSMVLDRAMWDYSATTSKYRNLFTGCDTKETKARIKSGAYILDDLNGGE